MQRVLVGRAGSLGTGTIPKDAILETVTARGIADLLDTIKVQHVSGGISTVALKTYLSGREKFQGETCSGSGSMKSRICAGPGPVMVDAKR